VAESVGVKLHTQYREIESGTSSHLHMCSSMAPDETHLRVLKEQTDLTARSFSFFSERSW